MASSITPISYAENFGSENRILSTPGSGSRGKPVRTRKIDTGKVKIMLQTLKYISCTGTDINNQTKLNFIHEINNTGNPVCSM
jgi:hypothetical protein